MTIAEQIESVLAGNAALTALVPAERIKVPGQWQNLARPYIVHFPVTPDPIQTHEGRVGTLVWEHYQVSVFSLDWGSGQAAMNAAIRALEGLHLFGSPVDDSIMAWWIPGTFYLGRDDEFKVEHFASNFKIVQTF